MLLAYEYDEKRLVKKAIIAHLSTPVLVVAVHATKTKTHTRVHQRADEKRARISVYA